MDRGLIVFEDTPSHRDLLREAGEHAAGVGAELRVLTLVPAEEFDRDADTLESIRSIEDAEYSANAILEAARHDVEEVVAEELDGLGEETTIAAVAAVVEDGDRADEILEVAATHDCDHVYLIGKGRSPTGKAIFGDVAQRVILNFDGYVTIATE